MLFLSCPYVFLVKSLTNLSSTLHKYPIQLWMIIWNWHLGPILVEQMSVGCVGDQKAWSEGGCCMHSKNNWQWHWCTMHLSSLLYVVILYLVIAAMQHWRLFNIHFSFGYLLFAPLVVRIISQADINQARMLIWFFTFGLQWFMVHLTDIWKGGMVKWTSWSTKDWRNHTRKIVGTLKPKP